MFPRMKLSVSRDENRMGHDEEVCEERYRWEQALGKNKETATEVIIIRGGLFRKTLYN